MIKEVHNFKDIREQILRGVSTLADPIVGTMGPKGRNVLFENANGSVVSSNDGVTIAKNITVEDPIENAIIEVVKGASLRTNNDAGDGTSTTVLLSSVLIKEGFKLIDSGWNPMDLKKQLELFKDRIIAEIKKGAIKVKNDKELYNIALISSNNDHKIAKEVLQVVKTAGLEGMVFLEPNKKNETEIIEEIGFNIESGMLGPELRTSNQMNATYLNAPMFITDKRIYYSEEAETILNTVLQAGYDQVVVVARDFIGQSINTFIANHTEGVCKVLLVKDPKCTEKDNESMQDLATYVDGNVISEKTGSIVDNITIDDFVLVEKVYSDPTKTLVVSSKKTKRLKDRVKMIKGELEKNKDDKVLKSRLASLTRGMVTIKIGGATNIEINENIYRFEDAISATRAAMKDGYLVGGGISIKNAFHKLEATEIDAELLPLFRKYSEANIRQIAENCGEHAETIMRDINKKGGSFGYNAMTGAVEDLSKAGVTDPYLVTEMSITNSVSVASQILSSNHLIINKIEKQENGKSKTSN